MQCIHCIRFNKTNNQSMYSKQNMTDISIDNQIRNGLETQAKTARHP